MKTTAATPKALVDLRRYVNQQDATWARIAFKSATEEIPATDVVAFLTADEKAFCAKFLPAFPLSIIIPRGWVDSSGDSMGDWMPSISSRDGRFQMFVDDEAKSWQTRELGAGDHRRFTVYQDGGDVVNASDNLADVIASVTKGGAK